MSTPDEQQSSPPAAEQQQQADDIRFDLCVSVRGQELELDPFAQSAKVVEA